MDSTSWDERYAASDLVWPARPNRWVADLTADLPPGRALDVAGGEGRHAIWLAERGWRVTVLDFSVVALDRGRRLARQRLSDQAARLAWVHADARRWNPPPQAYDLVLVAYLQLPADQRTEAIARVAAAVAPGGLLLVVAHDRRNLAEGAGGPQDPTVLYTAEDVAGDLHGSGLRIERASTERRPVEGSARNALDTLLLARRSTSSGGTPPGR